MSKYDEGIEVNPRKRADLRRLANTVRTLTGVPNNEKFPVMEFLEMVLPKIFDDFTLEVVPKDEMGNKHGETRPKRHLIRLREDVYEGACDGNGRDLYTIAHEIGHLFLHTGDYSFAWREGQSIPLRKNSEWQADAFAGELLMPYTAIKGMSLDEVKLRYGVSISAARVQCKVAGR